jgi:two-component system, chemotaxis family, sensor kinase Cph1
MPSLDLISQVKQSIAQLTDPQSLPSDLDLTNCDREPIHIPSAIQSHGLLLTFAATDLTILQVSQNCQAFLGKKPPELLGQSLSLLMDKAQFAMIRLCLR